MPGRHSPSDDTTAETTSERLFTAGDGTVRGRHVFGRHRRRRSLGRLAAAGLVFLAAGGGGVAYGLNRTGAAAGAGGSDAAAVAERTVAQRGSRSGGVCGRTGPGQPVVEDFLATQSDRFGQVIVDGQQDAVDCAAIRKFQTWAQLPARGGYADAQTADVARRLSLTDPSECAPREAATTVCVDLTHQTLWVERAGAPLLGPTVFRAGRAGLTVPAGRYDIRSKTPDATSDATGDRLPQWQGFYRNFGFHASTAGLYGDGDAGCLNLLPRDATSLYALTTVGTDVHVFGRTPA